MLCVVVLQPKVDHTHIWCLLNSGNYPAKPHTMECFMVLSSSDPGRGFENPVLQENASFLCGWWLITGAGQLIVFCSGTSHILLVADFVIKLMKQSITCLCLALLHENSGFSCCKDSVYKVSLPQNEVVCFDDLWVIAESRADGPILSEKVLILSSPWSLDNLETLQSVCV